MHKESEIVIANVNTWVSEQRNNSEKLAMKIREQATYIGQIMSDKERLQSEKDLLKDQIKKMSEELESAVFNKEKIKVYFLQICCSILSFY